nr:MAG TPA: hypothetical protein [Caudoviricetes sp.]
MLSKLLSIAVKSAVKNAVSKRLNEHSKFQKCSHF